MKSFFTGFAIGVGAGLVLAPDAGSKTRSKIMEKFGNMADKVSASSEPMVNAVRSRVEQIAENEFAWAPATTAQSNVSEIETTHVLNILNSASKTRLMKVSGIGEATARRIIDGRPYTDVNNMIDGQILSPEVLEKLKKLAMEEAEEEAA